MSSLSPSAKKIQDTLKTLGFNNEVVESTVSSRTAAEAAERVGCGVGQIVKSLIFKGSESGKAILVLTSGANRVDEKLISSYSGEKIQRADPEFVRAVTGFAIGGVPPIGHPNPLDTYIDNDLMEYQEIWAAAGTPNALFKLSPDDLQTMTRGRVIKVKN
jgi:prolyl-tRNA editing enzyme YbaK/EbsC (Cys-tRNA(Pro) deacylase)